jgi:hypothetical protein
MELQRAGESRAPVPKSTVTVALVSEEDTSYEVSVPK